VEGDVSYDPVRVEIELEKLKEIVKELNACLSPLVPYKRDPLEFSEAAHDVKDAHAKRALSLLPSWIVEEVSNAK
jgi:hypothetical protein